MMCLFILVAFVFVTGCSPEPLTPKSPPEPNANKARDNVPAAEPTTNDAGTAVLKKEPTMKEELIKFIQSPDRESFLAFRGKVIASDEYNPYSDEIDQASELMEANKLEEALALLRDSMKNLMLSPRAHQFLGFLHHKLGDDEAAQMELVVGKTCLDGLLSTGNGSREEPYVVLRTSDEYDVIEYFEKQFKQQSLVHEGDRHFDHIVCTDGSEYWFDITDAYDHLSKSFGQ